MQSKYFKDAVGRKWYKVDAVTMQFEVCLIKKKFDCFNFRESLQCLRSTSLTCKGLS